MTVALIGCASAGPRSNPTTDPGAQPPSVAMPPLRLPGLHATDAALTLGQVVDESPANTQLGDTLVGAGFRGASQRTLAGRHGAVSRVVMRAWSFSSSDGAASFLAWLSDNVGGFVGDATPVPGSPGGVSIWLHEPTGCCHNEVPIYLAAWQRGPVVWTMRASGAKIRTAPVLALVRSATEGS